MVIKYVVFEMGEGENGLYMPILFLGHVTHSQVKIEGATPISAGFYNTKAEKAFGKSESLKLESVPERDSKLCWRALDGYGTAYFLKSLYD